MTAPSDDRPGDLSRDLPRDAHLRLALRHAPDHDAAAPPRLSAGILAQARASVQALPAARKPAPPPWWQQLWERLATPAFGGAFASLMLAGVIGVMWQGGPPPESQPGRSAPSAPPVPPAPPSPSSTARQEAAAGPAPAPAPSVAAEPAPGALQAPAKATPPGPPAQADLPRAAASPRPAAPARDERSAVEAAPVPGRNAGSMEPDSALSDHADKAKNRSGPGPAPTSMYPPLRELAGAAAPVVAAPPAAPPAGPPTAPPAAAPATSPAAPPPAPAAMQSPAPTPPLAMAKARSAVPEAARDALRQTQGDVNKPEPAAGGRAESDSGATARRERSDGRSDGAATAGALQPAQTSPAGDPLAAPLAALAGAAADDQRSFEGRTALLDARRAAAGPWTRVDALPAAQGRTILAPDGRVLGRLLVDDRSVTWQAATGPAWRASRAAAPR